MTYAKIENNSVVEYPVYEGDIRLRYSNVSFASPFEAPDGYEFVVDTHRPAVDYKQNCIEGDPVLSDGVWTRNWLLIDATAQEIADRLNEQWANVRSDRNRRLSACDWTQLPDAPLTNVQMAAWAVYRQALRDITTQSDPFNIVWPQEPE